MTLSRQALDGYDALLSRQEDAAAEYVRRRLEAWMQANPGASVAEVREYAIDCANDAATAYGDAASSIAADLYDLLADQAGKRLERAQIDTSGVRPYIEKEVRYQAGKLVDGATTAFVRQVALCASDQVSRRANATMRLNASRDGVRWARVPMGGETCTFCAMLASRGFVFRSARTAGKGDHWHRGCRCKVVPETAGAVEGYDPGGLYGRWRKMEEIDRDESISAVDKAALKANVTGSYSGPRRVAIAVGAKALRDYLVNMPGGSETRFYPGSEIEEKAVFAGKGSEKELRVRNRLSETYGGNPDDWYHSSGEGWLFDPADNGRIKKAEVHWMGNDEVGLYEFYFKRWVGRYRDV